MTFHLRLRIGWRWQLVWCFVSKVWGACPRFWDALTAGLTRSGEWHFIVTANTEQLSKMAGIVTTSILPQLLPPKYFTLCENVRRCFTHNDLPYLSALNPDQKICPPSELLTRSTKCSFALRTSTGTTRDICGICKGPFHFPYQLQSYQRTVSPSGFVDSIHMMNLRQTRTYDMDTIDIYI